MGLIRLFSRQIVFGIGKTRVNLRQKLWPFTYSRSIDSKKVVEILLVELQAILKTRRLLGFTVLSLCNIVLAYGFTIPSMFLVSNINNISINDISGNPGIVSLLAAEWLNKEKPNKNHYQNLAI